MPTNRSELSRIFTVNSPETFESPTCKSVCQNVTASCQAYLTSIGQASKLPNCAAIDPTSNTPIYPVGNTTVTSQLNSNISYSIPCNQAFLVISNFTAPPTNCKHPFALSSKTGGCSIKCPRNNAILLYRKIGTNRGILSSHLRRRSC